MLETLKKIKRYQIYLIIIFFVGLFLRLYKLDAIPYAIHGDEAGLWYNVKSLLNYGVDQSGNTWPLLFANYHSEQSAMYTYLALLCVKLFGDTLFAIRLPAVLNFCLVFIFGNAIILKIFKDKKINVIFSLAMVFCPYFILSQRMALDCNLMLGFSTGFIYFLLEAIDKETWQLYLLAGFIGGFTFYTYAISYVTIPIFVTIVGVYLIIHKKISIKNAIVFLSPIIALGIPLLLIQVINILELNEVVCFGITLPNFDNSRHGELSMKLSLIDFVRPFLFMFVTSNNRLYECILDYGSFQHIFIPFFFIGLFFNISKLFNKENDLLRTILTLFWISVYVTAVLIGQNLTTWHLNSCMLISIVFIMDGLLLTYNKLKKKNIHKFFAILIFIIFLFCTFSFIHYYYIGEYATDEAQSYFVFDDLNPAISYAKSLSNNQEIYIATPSIIYKLYNNISPTENPSSYTGRWENLIQIDGYYFDMSGKTMEEIVDGVYIVYHNNTKLINLFKETGLKQYQINSYIVFTK